MPVDRYDQYINSERFRLSVLDLYDQPSTCGHFARARSNLSGSSLKYLLRARSSNPSEICGAGGATKNLGDF